MQMLQEGTNRLQVWSTIAQNGGTSAEKQDSMTVHDHVQTVQYLLIINSWSTSSTASV